MRIDDIRTDGGTQPRDAIDTDVVSEYADAMRFGVEFPAVTVFYDGDQYWLADGFHRLSAARQAGLNEINADVHQGSRRDAILHSVGANSSHGLRRTNADKRRAVMALLNDDEWRAWSDREIARRCAVNDKTVGNIRRELSAENPQINTPRKVERNGTTYTQNTANIGKRDSLDFDEDEPVNMAVYGTEDDLIRAGREALQQEYEREIEQKVPHVSHNSGENEWYTPSEYIESARAVMGGIDLDPASSEIANRTVKAAKYYTKEDDGLKQEWTGKVWMNPPYAQPLIRQFSEAVSERYRSGKIDEAIVLVNNATETGWFQTMVKESSAICFPRTRIRFLDMDGNPSGAPLQGQAILYFGFDKNVFKNEFSKYGAVVYGTA